MQRLFRAALAACLLVTLCASLSAPVAAADNLLANTGFESSAAWSLCGSAQIVQAGQAGVTAAMVRSGQRALRLTYTANNKCGEPVFDPDGAATQSLAIPANAPAVTVSFWYSRVGNPVWPVKVSIATPGGFGYLTQVNVDNLPGWHQFRYELTTSQLQRVRGQTLVIELASEYDALGSNQPDAPMPGFYIDDVSVVAATERTGASARPADFPAAGRPIVYLDAALDGIARLNADGSGAERIYSATTRPTAPVWSNRGDRVAVIEGWLNPENNTDVTVNPAFISKIVVISTNGSGAREVLRTTGLPGVRPVSPTPGNPERPALDVEASYVTWSPDDQTLAVSLCARNRSQSGSSSDPTCWVELFDVASGQSRGRFEPAFAPRWGGTNRLIYVHNDSYSDKPQGVYEVDMGANPPAERLLIPGMGRKFDPSFYTDRVPAWSPDGQRFVTVRNLDGYHYEGTTFVVHYAIMLFDRDAPTGRQIMLADHGTPTDLRWTSNDNFLIYTLFKGNRADIWWLDLRSGATGPLTTNGASVAADWSLSCASPPCSSSFQSFLPLLQYQP